MGSTARWWAKLSVNKRDIYLDMFQKANPKVDIYFSDKSFRRCRSLIHQYIDSYDIQIKLNMLNIT